MLSSFGPNLLSLELIIVCDCMFPSTVFSLAFREERGRGWEGISRQQPQPVLLCIILRINFCFKQYTHEAYLIDLKMVLQLGAGLKGEGFSFISGAEKAQSPSVHPF